MQNQVVFWDDENIQKQFTELVGEVFGKNSQTAEDTKLREFFKTAWIVAYCMGSSDGYHCSSIDYI
jgi:hypothetical protein